MTDLPDGTRLGRVELTVEHIEPCVAYYRDVIGLEVIDQTAEVARLGVDDRVLIRLQVDSTVDARPATAAGLFHVALLVPTRSDLGAVASRLRAADALTGASDHAVSDAVYSRDPEGNGIEIYQDTPPDTWSHTPDGQLHIPTRPLDIGALVDESSGERTLPTATTVGHVHLEVTDLTASKSFYIDSLGFRPRYVLDHVAFVAVGDYHHHLGLNTWNGRSTKATGRGLAWFEVIVPTETAFATLTSRMMDADTPAHQEGEKQLVLTDPDGIDIRVTVEGTGPIK